MSLRQGTDPFPTTSVVGTSRSRGEDLSFGPSKGHPLPEWVTLIESRGGVVPPFMYVTEKEFPYLNPGVSGTDPQYLLEPTSVCETRGGQESRVDGD